MRVELRDVRKDFGAVHALAGVSLALPAGARVALIGPNGSGKTTLIRAILGLVEHDGEVSLDGRAAFRERAALAERIAYVPQLAPQMAVTVRELVRATARLRGLSEAAIGALADEMGLDLAEVAPRAFRGLSGGTKQKLLIALALAAEASLYVLDEPTASLDAAARARFFATFAKRAPGATLILCSHRLEEIRQLVDHVVALEDGKLAFAGPATEYLAAQAVAIIEVQVEPGDDAWLRAHGFTAGAPGAFSRVVEMGQKMATVTEVVRVLGPRLRDLTVRDLEHVAAGAPAAPLLASVKEARDAA